jgi:hypothetical protein
MKNSTGYFKIVLAFLVISIFASCRPDPPPPDPEPETGTLTVHFDLNFNGQPFALYTPFFDPNFNYRIQPELLKFILTNLKLKNTAGTESIITDAKIINFTSANYSFAITIEPGDFQGLKFGIGVGDSATNHGDPALFPSSHALSYNGASDMHWTWNTGYIFLKFEGRADTTTTGTGALNQLFALHSGDDPQYGEVTFYSSSFSIAANQNTDFHINVDVAKFLYSATDTINIKTENATHSNNPLSVKFSQIYLNAFSVQ